MLLVPVTSLIAVIRSNGAPGVPSPIGLPDGLTYIIPQIGAALAITAIDDINKKAKGKTNLAMLKLE